MAPPKKRLKVPVLALIPLLALVFKYALKPFSLDSTDGVKVSIRLEVKHYEIPNFDTVTSIPAHHGT